MQFPVNLNLSGRPVLVVGAGRIAHRKVQQLLIAGADVTVIGPEVLPELRELPVRIEQREYEHGDVAGFRLVITATGNLAVDQQVYNDAEERNIWVNSADDPSRCTFTLPAVLRRGSLMITVSTGGASPALASYVREKLEAAITPDFAEVVATLAAERAAVHSVGETTEDIDWRPIIEAAIVKAGVESNLFTVREISEVHA